MIVGDRVVVIAETVIGEEKWVFKRGARGTIVAMNPDVGVLIGGACRVDFDGATGLHWCFADSVRVFDAVEAIAEVERRA